MKPERDFVRRLGAMFGSIDPSTAADTIAEYTSAMRGQSAATLGAAADILARQHKYRSWPSIAECLDAVSAAKRRSQSAGVGLTTIDDFDGWWSERMNRIRHATTEAQIEAELRQIEPYAAARWIASHRMPDAIAAAEQRRQQWTADSGRTMARRMIGEHDE